MEKQNLMIFGDGDGSGPQLESMGTGPTKIMESEKVVNMTIHRTYPPWVKELRERYYDLIQQCERDMVARANAIVAHREEDRIRELKQIQRRFIEETRPIGEELARLENLAQVTYVMGDLIGGIPTW